MPKKRKSFSQFQDESLRFIALNTPFTNLGVGSSVRSITDIMNTQMARLSGEIADSSSMAYLDTASGYYLDLIGSIFGVSRLNLSNFKATAGDKLIKFYVTGVNTLKRVLGSNVIPAGIKISRFDDGTSLTTSNSTSFNNTDTFVFVSVSTSSDGLLNIGPGEFTVHDLGNPDVYVTNTNAINYSKGRELDSSFRSRISNAAVASEGANSSNIISGLMRFQDVASVDLRLGVSGSGSYDVYLLPTGNRVSQSTLAMVRESLASSTGFGISFNIREYDYIPVKIEVKISFSNRVNDSLKETIIRQAEFKVEAAIGAMRPGDDLSMSRIVSAVLSADSSISSAEVVFLCINKRVQAIRDLRLEEDELFVPDEDEINPIMVRQ